MRASKVVLRKSTLLCLIVILALIHRHVYTNTPETEERSTKAKYALPTVAEGRKLLPNNKNDAVTVKRNEVARLPQVIGIGAKKCGTGALRYFLSHHPRVQLAKITEPHFFDNNSTFAKGLNHYLSLMPPMKQNKLTMEITPKYFVTAYVPGRIREMYRRYLTKQPKFIVILCNPTDRLFSEYVHTMSSLPRYHLEKQMRKYGSVNDFATDALRNITAKLPKAGTITGKKDNVEFVNYITRHYEVSPLTNGIYVFHLMRWLSYFPSRQILVVNGNDLIERPWDVLREVQNFLGIEQVVTKHDFRYDTVKGFYCIGRCMGRAKGRTRSNNTESRPAYLPLTEEVRKALRTFYSPFDESLFRLLNMTLNW